MSKREGKTERIYHRACSLHQGWKRKGTFVLIFECLWESILSLLNFMVELDHLSETRSSTTGRMANLLCTLRYSFLRTGDSMFDLQEQFVLSSDCNNSIRVASDQRGDSSRGCWQWRGPGHARIPAFCISALHSAKTILSK